MGNRVWSVILANVLAYGALIAAILLGAGILSFFGGLEIRSRKLAILMCMAVGFASVAGIYFAFDKWLQNRKAIASWLEEKLPRKRKAEPFRLTFKSNQAAFDYACIFLNCRLQVGVVLPGLVVDGSKRWRKDKPVLYRTDGFQTALVHVASDDGGFRALGAYDGQRPEIAGRRSGCVEGAHIPGGHFKAR